MNCTTLIHDQVTNASYVIDKLDWTLHSVRRDGSPRPHFRPGVTGVANFRTRKACSSSERDYSPKLVGKERELDKIREEQSSVQIRKGNLRNKANILQKLKHSYNMVKTLEDHEQLSRNNRSLCLRLAPVQPIRKRRLLPSNPHPKLIQRKKLKKSLEQDCLRHQEAMANKYFKRYLLI